MNFEKYTGDFSCSGKNPPPTGTDFHIFHADHYFPFVKESFFVPASMLRWDLDSVSVFFRCGSYVATPSAAENDKELDQNSPVIEFIAPFFRDQEFTQIIHAIPPLHEYLGKQSPHVLNQWYFIGSKWRFFFGGGQNLVCAVLHFWILG